MPFTDDPTKLKAFKYERPAADKPKKIVWLARTDRLFADVQVLTQGGEAGLHSHRHVDGFWFVLKGRCRFYSDKTTVAAELGQHEGILAPRNVKYWFESVGEEPLELLQVECSDVAVQTKEQLLGDRTYYGAQPPSGGTVFSEAKILETTEGKSR